MVCSTFLCLLVALPAQSPHAHGAAAKQQVSTEDNWFTNVSIDNLLGRWADQAVARYELDAEQAEKLRKMLRVRWSTFLRNNRNLSVFDAVEREWLKTQQDMRKLLTPAQQVQLNADAIEAAARFRTLAAATGNPRRSRAGVHDAERTKRATTLSAAGRRLDEELLRWDYFVAEFIERYQLDDAQRDAAQSVLRECKARALEHLSRNRVRVARVEESLATGGIADADQRSEIEAMYGPIDNLFAELKRRVETIPTATQTAFATHE